MTEVAEVLYLAKNRATGCWEHASGRRYDGQLDIRCSPRDSNGFSANPAQLFAAGWSARVDHTIGVAAFKLRVVLSDNSRMDVTVDLYCIDGAYCLKARLDASLSELPPEIARLFADLAHQAGPSYKTVRGSIDVTIDMV